MSELSEKVARLEADNARLRADNETLRREAATKFDFADRYRAIQRVLYDFHELLERSHR